MPDTGDDEISVEPEGNAAKIGWVAQPETSGPVHVVPRSCPQCGDPNGATPASGYSLPPWTIKTCAECGFTYITSAPAYDALFEHMAWEKTAQLENERRESTRRLQQKLSKKTRWRLHLLPRKRMPELLAVHAVAGNVIDLGCGDGGQMAGIADHFVPHGIEIASAAAARADAWFRERGGYAINAACLDGLKQFPDAYFTAATLRSYLEHELHPSAVLAEVARVLKPGAVAIVKVPNYASLNRQVMGNRWCGFRYPDHLNYFTPKSLRTMAAKHGLRLRFGPTWCLPTSDNMWALLRKE